LKAAVIGSAAIAATAGAGTAGLALTGNTSLIPLNQIDWIQPGSPGPVCDVCTTDTNCNSKDIFTGSGTGANGLYLWLRFLNVPAIPQNKQYDIDISPAIGTSCTSSLPLYRASTGALTQWALDPKNYECHPHSMGEVPGGKGGSTLQDLRFTISTMKCILVLVRLSYCAPVSRTVITVTGTLRLDNTVIETCMHDITFKS
jgi:hypothetical protein